MFGLKKVLKEGLKEDHIAENHVENLVVDLEADLEVYLLKWDVLIKVDITGLFVTVKDLNVAKDIAENPIEK